MHPFRYQRAADVPSAVAAVSQDPGAQFFAAGTSQVDLMQEGVQRPTRLVDVSRLPLAEVARTPTGGLHIGANVTNAAAADHPLVRGTYAAVSEALHAGASPQIRNVASMAGNVLQRTRCPYLRDPAAACNKRDPGTGCAAVAGYNRMHAIFGQTDEGATGAHTCIAVHPSDLAVALAAHEAVLHVEGPAGARRLAFDDLHRLPGDRPDLDTTLGHGDLIVALELPAFRGRSHYLKVRDRASYAYALVSCAVALELDGGRIRTARVALGSVAHKPWRARAAEAMLEGQAPDGALFREAAARALDGAVAYRMNAYKPALGRALVERGLRRTAGLEPLPGPAGTAFAASVGGIGGVHAPEEYA
ncbi:dehydrogenase [Gemmatimonadetes bacterium T265]|nr:dehydrogenase [Gemmatimonadetes bacterium T265]